MEKSIVRERLVEAAILAAVLRPGVFTIKVEAVGVHIIYIFEYKSDHYSSDNITSWEAIERANNNPLAIAMTDLLRAARDFKP